jgi:hypothetical protein
MLIPNNLPDLTGVVMWCSMFCQGSEATTTIEIDDEVVGVVKLDVCEGCKQHFEQNGLDGAYSTD